jgi:hypothetical protein
MNTKDSTMSQISTEAMPAALSEAFRRGFVAGDEEMSAVCAAAPPQTVTLRGESWDLPKRTRAAGLKSSVVEVDDGLMIEAGPTQWGTFGGDALPPDEARMFGVGDLAACVLHGKAASRGGRLTLSGNPVRIASLPAPKHSAIVSGILVEIAEDNTIRWFASAEKEVVGRSLLKALR